MAQKIIKDSNNNFILFRKIREEHLSYFSSHFRELETQVSLFYERDGNMTFYEIFESTDLNRKAKIDSEPSTIKSFKKIEPASTVQWSLKYLTMVFLIIAFCIVRYFVLMDQMTQLYNQFYFYRNVVFHDIYTLGSYHFAGKQTQNYLQSNNATLSGDDKTLFDGIYNKTRLTKFVINLWGNVIRDQSLATYNSVLFTQPGCDLIPDNTFCQKNYTSGVLSKGLKSTISEFSATLQNCQLVFKNRKLANSTSTNFKNSFTFLTLVKYFYLFFGFVNQIH